MSSLSASLPRVSITDRGLTIDGDCSSTEVVDVWFEGHRVWSARLPDEVGAPHLLPWHPALEPHLRGTADVTVRRSSDGELLAEGTVTFPGGGRVRVVDPGGRWLQVSKWDQLGVSFEGQDPELTHRLLTSSDRLVEDLLRWGYQPYIVGGTLLGALRSGELLPFDDDVDLAWLSPVSDPIGLALGSYRMQDLLEEAGYFVVRHSQTHIQVTFLGPDRRGDHHVDIFTGWHRDGVYYQPFALAGDLPPEAILPPTTLSVSGHEYPAPARPEAWLEFAYGPRWLVPDPSFRFETPRHIQRFFRMTFGTYNANRLFWELHYGARRDRDESEDGLATVAELCRMAPRGAPVVDLGCGDGRLTDALAESGLDVVGVDYSIEALALARGASHTDATFAYLNLNDGYDAARFVRRMRGRGPWWVFSRETLHTIPKDGRITAFATIAGLLGPQTCALLTVFTDFAENFDRPDPSTWHMREQWVREEAGAAGLSVEVTGTRRVPHASGHRLEATMILRLSSADLDEPEPTNLRRME